MARRAVEYGDHAFIFRFGLVLVAQDPRREARARVDLLQSAIGSSGIYRRVFVSQFAQPRRVALARLGADRDHRKYVRCVFLALRYSQLARIHALRIWTVSFERRHPLFP